LLRLPIEHEARHRQKNLAKARQKKRDVGMYAYHQAIQSSIVTTRKNAVAVEAPEDGDVVLACCDLRIFFSSSGPLKSAGA